MSDKYAALHHPDVQAAIAEDIARQKEILSYQIKIGLDGNHYAVFQDSVDFEMTSYKIISLRSTANGFKQRDVKSAGHFKSYEEACKVAEKMNYENNRIYTTYMAQKVN